MSTRTTTFSERLLGSLAEFLSDEKMDCLATQKGLVELVVALSRYQEEGTLLFPKIVVCDNLESTLVNPTVSRPSAPSDRFAGDISPPMTGREVPERKRVYQGPPV